MGDHVIISRHPAAVEFIRRALPEFEDAPVLAQAAPEQVRGKIVAGNLPLYLAVEAAEVIAVEFDGPPPRGQEYTVADMEAAGAILRRYVVLNEGQLLRLGAILALGAEGIAHEAADAIRLAKCHTRFTVGA